MFMKKISKFLLALFIIGFNCYGEEDYTGEMPPIEIGQACESTHPGYTWRTASRTEWSLAQLCPTPAGYDSAEEWNDRDNFLSSLNTELNGQSSTEAYANACVEIWGEFLSGNVELFVKLQRTITTEIKAIRCQQSVWSLDQQSSSTSNEVDESEWVKPSTSIFVVGTTTGLQIKEALDTYLSQMNSQPGADTRPDHSYTSP
jgi:hypothetical protein